MKTCKILVPIAALLLFAGQAAAQSEEENPSMEAREAEVARELEELERRMARDASRIAELTRERLPQIQEYIRRFEVYDSNKPRLGVNIGEIKGAGPVEGVKIAGVSPGSAADDAGLRAGDIITAINGESMSAENSSEANRMVFDFMDGVEEGDILEIEYMRDGKVGTVEVEPRPVDMRAYSFGFPRDFSMPSAPEIHISPDKVREQYVFAWPGNVWADMELVELSEGLGKYFGTGTGVLVVHAPESDALQLEDGDVILSIDGRDPKSVRHALRILGSYQSGESLEIEIMRDKRKRTLEIEMPDDRRSYLWAPSPAPQPAVAPRPAAAPHPAPHPAPAPHQHKT